MNSQTQNNSQRPYHFWMIHKRVLRQKWNELSSRQRDLVTHDTESETFKLFNAEVTAETERAFEDETFYYNQAYTFKDSYYYDRV